MKIILMVAVLAMTCVLFGETEPDDVQAQFCLGMKCFAKGDEGGHDVKNLQEAYDHFMFAHTGGYKDAEFMAYVCAAGLSEQGQYKDDANISWFRDCANQWLTDDEIRGRLARAMGRKCGDVLQFTDEQKEQFRREIGREGYALGTVTNRFGPVDCDWSMVFSSIGNRVVGLAINLKDASNGNLKFAELKYYLSAIFGRRPQKDGRIISREQKMVADFDKDSLCVMVVDSEQMSMAEQEDRLELEKRKQKDKNAVTENGEVECLSQEQMEELEESSETGKWFVVGALLLVTGGVIVWKKQSNVKKAQQTDTPTDFAAATGKEIGEMKFVAEEWWKNNHEKFEDDKQAIIREKIACMSDEKARLLDSLNLKDPKSIFWVCFLTGGMGVHRFMIGDFGMGFLELFTCAGCGVLGLIDLITIGKKIKRMNFDLFAVRLAEVGHDCKQRSGAEALATSECQNVRASSLAEEWWKNNHAKFEDDKQAIIREKIACMSDEEVRLLDSLNLKDPKSIFWVCFLTGGMGIHRFMIGDFGMGFLELFTCAGCGVLGLIDAFTISKKVRRMNFESMAKYLALN